MKLRWTARAKKDLLEIGAYIARDNPAAARRWIERLRERARAAAEAPRTGRVVPELGREGVREDAVHVLTVFEGHRMFRGEDDT